MPKLKKVSFFCRTKDDSGLRFDIEVRVSQNGWFYGRASELPSTIRTALGIDDNDEFRSETLSGFHRQVEEKISRFEEMLMDEGKSKVILYEIQMRGDLTPDLSGQDKKARRYFAFEHEGVDVAIGICWRVAFKHKIMGEVSYTYENGGHFHNGDGMKELEWSESREQWFQSFEKGLIDMIDKVDRFFGAYSGKKLEALIDSGRILIGKTE